MFSLDMLDCPVYSLSLSTWNFLCWMGWGDQSKSVLLFGFLCGTPPSCLKVTGGGGLQDFSVSPGSESLSLCHWAWVTEPEFEPEWAWECLSAWAEPELDNKDKLHRNSLLFARMVNWTVAGDLYKSSNFCSFVRLCVRPSFVIQACPHISS